MIIGAYSCIAKIWVSLSDSLQVSVRLFNVTMIYYIMDYLTLLLCPAIQLYDYAMLCSLWSYCYMKLQGCIRLVNVTWYNYIMDYITLLLCPATLLYDYARQYISVCSAIVSGVYCYPALLFY